jgi:hypothetical protein
MAQADRGSAWCTPALFKGTAESTSISLYGAQTASQCEARTSVIVTQTRQPVEPQPPYALNTACMLVRKRQPTNRTIARLRRVSYVIAVSATGACCVNMRVELKHSHPCTSTGHQVGTAACFSMRSLGCGLQVRAAILGFYQLRQQDCWPAGWQQPGCDYFRARTASGYARAGTCSALAGCNIMHCRGLAPCNTM